MHVLVSGAGIAGPTLAYWLAKAGINVTIVEKASELLANGQNIDITGSARRVIDKMGLTEEVKKKNTTEMGTQFIGPEGEAFALLPVKEGQYASPTSEFEILRGDLALILYNATKDNPLITYIFNTTISQVIENSDKTVKVEFSDGKVAEYDVLCAADGQWSKVRKMCFPTSAVTVIDKGLYCAYWTIPRTADDNNYWNIYIALKSRGINLRPDPYGSIRACLTRMPFDETHAREWEEASRSDLDFKKTFIRREFDDAGWVARRCLDALDDTPDFYFQAIKQIKMKSWSNGRVVCLGDTAYAPTPLTGMGTSLALTGAYVLAGELSDLIGNLNTTGAQHHPSKAFTNFEANFRPFVDKTQKIPFFVPAVVHPFSSWKRRVLQSVISVAVNIANVQWIAKFFPQDDGETEDFVLPEYPKFLLG